jgi:response regulator RpfG family c-di-GMP phosphodiesterase
MLAAKPRILCVDDEPITLNLLAVVLEPQGYEVIKASNGKDAIEMISRQRIDLVLLDVVMPEVSGFEVCRRIKTEERFRHIPVVMITGLGSKEDRIKGIEAGAEDFIVKPFDRAEVLARIKMLLRVKDLNDRLNHAYDKITSLTSYGEKIVKTFDPLNFDFTSNIDTLVYQIIRQADETAEKPQIVIVGITDERERWQWHKYEFAGGRLEKTILNLDIQHSMELHDVDSAKIVFYNEADLDKSGFQPVVRRFKSIDMPVSNIVSYSSNVLCVLALNYGIDVTYYDAAVLNSLVMESLFLKTIAGQIKETDDAFAYTLWALARATEANDEDTGNHITRVGEYCALIARHLGMPEKFTSIIKLQAQMHDVGKIHTRPAILKKPGKLTPEEFEEIKQHTIYGARILGDHIRLTMSKNIAASHHERWDGSGYPHGLKGEQIHIEGRITSIADQYDALRNPRVYKPAFDHATAYGIITQGDGRTMPYHFDPSVLNAFRETSTQFAEVYEGLKG